MEENQVVNGSSYSFACPFNPGNPPLTTFLWRRASDNATWNSQNLTLASVNYLIDNTDFICTANNIMEPTFGLTKQGRSSGRFHMTVLCAY